MTPLKNQLNSAALELCRLDGVTGILLQQDGHVLYHDMPLDDDQTARLADLVRSMCGGYRKAHRVLRQVIIGYDCGALLVVSRDDAQLVILMAEQIDIDRVSATAARLITELFQRPLRLPRNAA